MTCCMVYFLYMQLLACQLIQWQEYRMVHFGVPTCVQNGHVTVSDKHALSVFVNEHVILCVTPGCTTSGVTMLRSIGSFTMILVVLMSPP